MADDNYAEQYDFLEPLVNSVWIPVIEDCVRDREGFDGVNHICRHFYSGAMDFMWQPEFRNRYLGGAMDPTFKVGLNRAFEFIAAKIPGTVWENPVRALKAREPFQYGPDALGDPNDPAVQMMYQMLQQEQQQRASADGYRLSLYDKWLNYTPSVTPDGGLAGQIRMMLVDAYLSGRGVMLPKVYKLPGGKTKLTGCFYDSSDNWWVDPAARNGLSDARFIIQRCEDYTWDIEKKYKLKEGCLRNKGNADKNGKERHKLFRGSGERSKGDNSDRMVYYKIWSKMGTGARFGGSRAQGSTKAGLLSYLDKEAGDYCHLVISDAVSWPLNAPTSKIQSSTDQEGIRELFRWPHEFWADGKWPVAFLDFYHRSDGAYPVSPLSSGLGQLVAMNVMMSHLIGRTWSASRDFYVAMESARKWIEPKLKSGKDLECIFLPEVHRDGIDKIFSIAKGPTISADYMGLMGMLTSDFERATGSNPMEQGLNVDGKVSRSATDVESKQAAINLRNSYFSKRLEEQQSELADMEKYLTREEIEAPDVEPLVGRVGAMLWTKHVTDEPFERCVYDILATIQANSMRKPNRQRDAQNINTVMPQLQPMLTAYAQETGDTNPLKALLTVLGQAIEMPEMDQIVQAMQQWVPMPPPPEAMEMQNREIEAKQQEQQAKTGAIVMKAQLDAAGKQIDMQAKQAEVEMKERMAQIEMAMKAMEMQFDARKAQQELSADAAHMQLDLASTVQKNRMEQASGLLKIDQDARMGEQKLKTQKALAKVKKPPQQRKRETSAA